MDGRGWEPIDPGLEIRRELPIGALLCVIQDGARVGVGRPPSLASNYIMTPPQLASVDVSQRSVYLQGIDSSKIFDTVHGRRSPTISATAGLQLVALTQVRSRRWPCWPPAPADWRVFS
jgi:hypothetical protein